MNKARVNMKISKKYPFLSTFFTHEKRNKKHVALTYFNSLPPISLVSKQEKWLTSLLSLSPQLLSPLFLLYQTQCKRGNNSIIYHVHS